MAEVLRGAPVIQAMKERLIPEVEQLKGRGVTPTLAILRVGERQEDLAYERGAVKRLDSIGAAVRVVKLPADVSQDEFDTALQALNEDDSVHGILLFAPLPKHLDIRRARTMLAPQKDVDGCTDASLAGVFTGSGVGFPPCTAQAVMEILHHYGIAIEGKKAAVIGRSLIIGRPAAQLLMAENATVVNLHRKTIEPEGIASKADILVAACGELRLVNPAYTNPDQVVIDVGVNWDKEKGGIAGDVDFDAVEPAVKAITPVPGGVGSVTTSVLASHVVEAAKRAAEK